jgi:DNA (cytosine-5)-methyltransferase 1
MTDSVLANERVWPVNYYNENDPFAAAWLRNLIKAGLIPHGDVDDRDIRDVRPGDLTGYDQCHFFAGIGGWSLALELAGWSADRPVWTGSCPCQPFSAAGRRKGFADERDLWPVWHGLIEKCRPAIVLGEQVARAVRDGWLDRTADDMERSHYAIGAALLQACTIGAPQERERLYFVARASGARLPLPEQETVRGSRGRAKRGATAERCRWPGESGLVRVAHGVPGRVGKLRALGNAIVPQIAAEFIRAAMTCALN